MYRIVEEYKTNLLATKKSEKTIENYCRVAKLMCDFISQKCRINPDEHLECVNGDMVKAWIATYRNNKDSTRNLYIIAGKSFLNDLFTSGKTATDLSIALPKTKTIVNSPERQDDNDDDDDENESGYSQKVFSPSDIQQMLSGCGSGRNGARARAMIALFLGSGMRASEVASLKIEEFQRMKEKGYVRCVRKGGEKKRIEIASFVSPYIEEYLNFRKDVQPDAPLFATRTGAPMNRREIYTVISTIQKKCNIKTGVHKFRHTVLSEAERVGGAAISRDIGNHHSFQITNRYVHTSNKERKEVLDKTTWAKDIFRH